MVFDQKARLTHSRISPTTLAHPYEKSNDLGLDSCLPRCTGHEYLLVREISKKHRRDSNRNLSSFIILRPFDEWPTAGWGAVSALDATEHCSKPSHRLIQAVLQRFRGLGRPVEWHDRVGYFALFISSVPSFK